MQESNVELFTALAKAQGGMKSVSKDREVKGTYSFKYATLSAIWDVIRVPLTSNGLAVVQLPTIGDRKVFVETRLLHSSGESIVSTIEMPVDKTTPQGFGSAISYARRYALSAILGVVSDDDDDDGVEASGQVAAVVHTFKAPHPPPKPPKYGFPDVPAPTAPPPAAVIPVTQVATPVDMSAPAIVHPFAAPDEQEMFGIADKLCACKTRAQFEVLKSSIHKLPSQLQKDIISKVWGTCSRILSPPPNWVDGGMSAEERAKYPVRGYMLPPSDSNEVI